MKLQADPQTKWQEFSRCLRGDEHDTPLRVAVLAAHPDDETIGASSLIATFPLTRVIFVTDGAPHDQSLWTGGPYESREHYAKDRRQEAICALRITGVAESHVSWLGAVDQEAALEMPSLAAKLERLIREIRVDILVTHPYEGGHPDHDSAALIARLVCNPLPTIPLLIEMTSYHNRDEHCVTGEFLNSEVSTELVCKLSDEQISRKRRMLDTYASQRLLLGSFGIERELFRRAPEYQFTTPPHEGKLWYECLGWPMSGERWSKLAASAISSFSKRAESSTCA